MSQNEKMTFMFVKRTQGFLVGHLDEVETLKV